MYFFFTNVLEKNRQLSFILCIGILLTSLSVCIATIIDLVLFSVYLQHQHVETPRIPEPRSSERPAARCSALWELRIHHGLNIPVFLLLSAATLTKQMRDYCCFKMFMRNSFNTAGSTLSVRILFV